MEKVVAFIDGSGLYVALQHTFQKATVDLEALVSKLVGNRFLIRAYYYGSGIAEPKEVVQRQQQFFQALRRIPHLEVRLGRLVQRGPIHMEKGVDVIMATDLLRLVDVYDTAILVSGDSDFLPAIQAVKDRGKVVELAFPPLGLSESLKAASDVAILIDEEFMKGCWLAKEERADAIKRGVLDALSFYEPGILLSQRNISEILEAVTAINESFQTVAGRDRVLIPDVSPKVAAVMSRACSGRTAFQHYVGDLCTLLEFKVENLKGVTTKHESDWKGLRLLEQFFAEQNLLNHEVRTRFDYLRKLILLRNQMLPYHRPSNQIRVLMAELGLIKQPTEPEDWQSNWNNITGDFLRSLHIIGAALDVVESKKG